RPRRLAVPRQPGPGPRPGPGRTAPVSRRGGAARSAALSADHLDAGGVVAGAHYPHLDLGRREARAGGRGPGRRRPAGAGAAIPGRAAGPGALVAVTGVFPMHSVVADVTARIVERSREDR